MSISELGNIHQSGNNQLSLDFISNSPSSATTRIADSVYAITSGKIIFHPEKSEIGENNFILKISYAGRSYSLSGIYRKEQIRSSNQEDFSATVVRIIRFDSILAFRNGRYDLPLRLGKEYEILTKSAYDILSYSQYNTTIH